MKILKPCPFCGSTTAPILSTIWECEMCANFEEEDCPECYETTNNDGCMHIVVCDMSKKGCGASTGWNLKKEKAIEAWNRRTNEN